MAGRDGVRRHRHSDHPAHVRWCDRCRRDRRTARDVVADAYRLGGGLL